MTFSELLVAFGNAIRAKNPAAIALLVVVGLLLLALVFGPSTLLNFIRILMPFWIPLLIYAVSYQATKEYQKRNPQFIDANIAAIAITVVVIVLYLVIRQSF